MFEDKFSHLSVLYFFTKKIIIMKNAIMPFWYWKRSIDDLPNDSFLGERQLISLPGAFVFGLLVLPRVFIAFKSLSKSNSMENFCYV